LRCCAGSGRFAMEREAHDHLGDIFATLDAKEFQRCFVAWVAALTGAPAEVIAIDGKTLRGSYQKKGAKEPIHMVSAFAARQRLVLGQVKVAEKSNEIVAIPALLAMMAIEGAIVTIDAMGCQREIAEQILTKKADYVLALKSLPPRRRGAIRAPFARMSRSSPPSREPTASSTRRSAGTRPSMAITAASKPGPPPPSTT
jgi:hypothetical protein